MEIQTDIRKRIANLTSYILNPLLLGMVMIVLLSFASTSSTSDAIKWALISIALTVLPVFLVIIYLVWHGKLDAIFINIREQRTKIYLLGGICTIIGFTTLNLLRAPSMLVSAFTTGLSITAIFMFINLWWKISLHTALASALATILLILYGRIAIVTVALIPLTGWARIELKSHSIAQVATGALLAALIVIVVFRHFITV